MAGLKVATFDAKQWRPGNNAGGSTLFKALGHPLAFRAAEALIARANARGPVAVYDPLGHAESFDALYGLRRMEVAEVYVQQVVERGTDRLGHTARLVTELGGTGAPTLLVAAFDAERLIDQIRHLLPAGTVIESFDALRMPEHMLSNRRNYLDPLNFATNFVLFREGEGRHTRLATFNYWGMYGAKDPGLWLCLLDRDGHPLAEWEQALPAAGGSVVIDSREVAARFDLDRFEGSLFVHAVRVVGHDIVKYALDTYGDAPDELSCTHDANSWPADLYAGLPAADAGERTLLWVQNSHPVTIPAGAIGFNLMGSQDVSAWPEPIPPFATRGIDLARVLPDARWPDQVEVRAGRYFVRPRYEIVRDDGRSRIAHANVERVDLEPDPFIPELGGTMGKGYVMPLPILPLGAYDSLALPTPMSTCQRELPLAVALYDAGGEEVARRYLGRIARRDSRPLDVRALLAEAGADLPSGYGHLEYLYDFSEGGEADGWLHAIGRYRQRASGHEAETSFGAHIFNTPLVYRDEPQSYNSRPPGLTTRLFLRLGPGDVDTMCHLIYPASMPWHPRSATQLMLHDGDGREVARREVSLPCGGSLNWRYHAMFDARERETAGDAAYIVVRDTTCRLFGFAGLVREGVSFSFDHMFGA